MARSVQPLGRVANKLPESVGAQDGGQLRSFREKLAQFFWMPTWTRPVR
jgi:hypothetical protein